MALPDSYKKLINKWLTKTHTVGSPDLDALINSDDSLSKLVAYFKSTNKTAFGEGKVESMTPVTQISAHHGLLTNVLTVVDDGDSGSVSIVDNKYTCDTGATSDGVASILTRRQLSYRAGQGAVTRFTALFDTPAANSIQAAGLITAENSLAFGYINESFGIIHAYNGLDELQELTLTIAAGAETATVTINAIAYTVPLSGEGTLWADAYEISESLSQQVPNYNFSSNESTVTAQAVIPGVQGSFDYSSDGSSVGAWDQLKAGAPSQTDFIPQSLWNEDTRISADTDVNLDVQLGNVYQIQFQYLGFGAINFFVEDKVTGLFVLVHRIRFANANTIPSVSSPSFRVGWLAQNSGNTTSLRIQGASASAFIEGKVVRDTTPQSDSNDQLAVGSLPTLIMALRNRASFNGFVNRTDLYPLFVNAATQVNKVAFFRVLLNPVFDAPVNFAYVDKENSIAEIAKDKVIVTGGQAIGTITVASGSGVSLAFNLSEKTDLPILPGSVIAIVAAASSNAGDCQATATWQEDL